MSLHIRNLTQDQRAAYIDILTESHDVSFAVSVYDQNEELLTTLQDQNASGSAFAVADGQVDVDVTRSIAYSMRLQVLDPGRKFVFDSAAPENGVFFHRFMGVDYLVRVPGLSTATEWVRVPIFYGPVTRFSRANEFVEVECQGKEILLQPPFRYAAVDIPETRSSSTLTLAEKITRAAAAFGEYKVRIDLTEGTGGRSEFMGRFGTNPWSAIGRLARSGGGVAYYDAEGFLVVGPRPSNASAPRYTFTEAGAIVSDPDIAFDRTGFFNVVEVYSVGVLYASARLPPGHPLSPEALARNGVPLEVVHAEEFQEGITTEEAAVEAGRILQNVQLGVVEAAFDSLPIPHLAPRDVVAIDYRSLHATFVLEKFAISLNSGGLMSIGFTKNLTAGVSPIVKTSILPETISPMPPLPPLPRLPPWHYGPTSPTAPKGF